MQRAMLQAGAQQGSQPRHSPSSGHCWQQHPWAPLPPLPPPRSALAASTRASASSPAVATAVGALPRSRSGAATLVKICGVTSPADAALALEAGADMVGMIMWPRAKRSVSAATARQIAALVEDAGAQAVGVFVDESAQAIAAACEAAGVRTAQLHGAPARGALGALPAWLQAVYVMHAGADGQLQTSPPEPDTRQPDWLLVDGLVGGSGQAFDWAGLSLPSAAARRGWLLAGGLHPGNVAQAVRTARPAAVDVSSGVAGPDGLAKDPARIAAFVKAVKEATASY